MNTRTILDRLLAFETVSRDPNMALIQYVEQLLKSKGIASTIIATPDGKKANLFATVGPQDKPGVMLSGHTDVVPVDGQNWSVEPFALTEKDGRIYGRGAADMKGFVASAIATCLKASQLDLKTPLHLALSHDEEIGCIGVRSLIDHMKQAPQRPLMCIVGEPTDMSVATGHKGKAALRARCSGRAAHSALAPNGVNAIYLAADFVSALRELQTEFQSVGAKDTDYDVPYTTLHVGQIEGGVALNIVPDSASVLFEFRNLAEDNPVPLLARLRSMADNVAQSFGDPDAHIEIEEVFAYPGLATPPTARIIAFVQSLLGSNGTIKVAFGTEGGLFDQVLGIPTCICGPGSMEQGHKPDEFVTVDQLDRCDAMLSRLIEHLEAGL